MKQRTGKWLFLAALFLWMGCERSPYPGYSEKIPGVWFKLHQFGEGESQARAGDYIKAKVCFRTMDDNVIYDSFWREINGEKVFHPDSLYKTDLGRGLKLLIPGDSVTFILKRENIRIDSIPESYADTNKWVKADVMVAAIIPEQEFERASQHAEWVHHLRLKEQDVLAQCLQQADMKTSPTTMGVYVKEVRAGSGQKLQKGDRVAIHYEGWFSDGHKFDSTRDRGEPFEYVIGNPDQLIRGMEISISLLTPGAKGKFVIPSPLAFGKSGSSTQIIPPYTPLIYEIEILNVR